VDRGHALTGSGLATNIGIRQFASDQNLPAAFLVPLFSGFPFL
jgi:hypothetical protein